MDTNTEILRQLVLEEIERLVDDAKHEGRAVHAGYLAGVLLASYPGADFSVGRIIGELVLAAGRAGVSVEVGEFRSLRDMLALQRPAGLWPGRPPFWGD